MDCPAQQPGLIINPATGITKTLVFTTSATPAVQRETDTVSGSKNACIIIYHS
jgi:hypothetical protein